MFITKCRRSDVIQKLLWLRLLQGAEAVWQTVTGTIVTFTTLRAARVKSLSVAIDPVQSGSGDPAPDNIRPISGWTGARVTRCGKNIFDESAANWKTGYLINASGEEASSSSYKYSQTFFRVKPNTVYAVQINKGSASNTAVTVPCYDANQDFLERFVVFAATTATGVMSGTFTTPADCEYIRLNVPAGQTTNVQIEEGSTATDYEAYIGATYEVDWTDEAGVVYGGTLDMTTGVLTVDRLGFVFDGTETWEKFFSNEHGCYRFTVDAVKASAGGAVRACSHFKNGNVTSGNSGIGYYAYTSGSLNSVFIQIRPDLTAIPDLASWKAWLAAQAAADTPVTCWFKVNSGYERTYQLDPVTVRTLLGVNNIWADTGDVTVKYRAD